MGTVANISLPDTARNLRTLCCVFLLSRAAIHAIGAWYAKPNASSKTVNFANAKLMWGYELVTCVLSNIGERMRKSATGNVREPKFVKVQWVIA